MISRQPVGVVAAASQRSGFDVERAQGQHLLLQDVNSSGVDVAGDGQMVGGRPPGVLSSVTVSQLSPPNSRRTLADPSSHSPKPSMMPV